MIALLYRPLVLGLLPLALIACMSSAPTVVAEGRHRRHALRRPCAVCHGVPGVPTRDIGRGLYPPPPDLAKTAPLNTPASSSGSSSTASR